MPLVCLFLVLAIGTVYWPVQHHNFITLDDELYITANAQVQQGLSREGFKWALTTDHAGFWIPLTWISHMLDCQLYGMNAGGHHMTNVILHILNTLLLLFVFRRMSGAFWPSSIIAVLYAIHPIHVESVAWASERKDVLFALFWMLSMWFYIRYTENPSFRRYLPVILCFFLGLLSKPMIVTLPFVLLLIDIWPLNRMQVKRQDDGVEQGQSRTMRDLILEKVPLFILSASVSVITFFLQKFGGAVTSLSSLSISDRIFNVFVSYGKYLTKMIWPYPLAILYPRQVVLPFWQVAISFLLLTGFSLVLIRYRKNHPYFLIGWLWFLGTMVPVIGIAQSGPQTMADRFAYIPFIGLYMMVAWGLMALLQRWPHKKTVSVLVGAAVLATLMLVARTQVGYWRNDHTLYNHALRTTTNNFVVHRNLGLVLAHQGRFNQALYHWRQALAIDPNYAQTYHDIGTVFMLKKDYDVSLKYLYQALKRRPNYARSHNIVGLVLMSQGKADEAVVHFRRALQIDPGFRKARKNLKKAQLASGQ